MIAGFLLYADHEFVETDNRKSAVRKTCRTKDLACASSVPYSDMSR
jgi:hypothetical protein